MHKRLKWNAVGLERKTNILYIKIKEEKEKTPIEHSKKYDTLERFLSELESILATINKIKLNLIPKLEKILRLEFKTPELIMVALSRPSIRKIYEDVESHLKNDSENPLKVEEFNELASSGDAANVLALIGDSVLDLAIVQLLWDSSLATAGDLSEKRKEFVSNKNLAKLCEKWDLYSYRLKRLYEPLEKEAKKETIEHEKATLIEAIYGVIYLEFGFEELIRTLPLIQ